MILLYMDGSVGISHTFLTALLGIALVFLGFALILVVVKLTPKMITNYEKRKEPKVVETAPTGTPLPSNESQGVLDLVDCDEKTAATIMAIVSKESKIPLNRLSFKSIKALEDK